MIGICKTDPQTMEHLPRRPLLEQECKTEDHVEYKVLLGTVSSSGWNTISSEWGLDTKTKLINTYFAHNWYFA